MLRIPDELKLPMRAWRTGNVPLPQGYVDFHAACAQRDLDLRPDWKVVEDHGLVDEGWMDGMRVRSVIVAVPADNDIGRALVVLQWHESGAWFQASAGGGHFRYEGTLLNKDGSAPS